MTIATDTPVKQIMQTNLVTVTPKTSIFEAAKLDDEYIADMVKELSDDSRYK